VSQPDGSAEPGRGAQRRRTLHEQRSRERAVSWLRQPGIVIFLGALVLAAGGWALLIRATHRIPVQDATVDGLALHVERVAWLVDQMEHGVNFQRPASMMPDLPEHGTQRVMLSLVMRNQSSVPRELHGEEFTLVPEIGDEIPPFGAVIGEASILPGQTLNTAIHFDLDTTKPFGKLAIRWRHGHRSVYLPVPDPPEHYHLQPRGGEQLPTDARLLLPLGDKTRGSDLFFQTYGCVACHGNPRSPGTNNVGPHLGGIGVTAASRIKGKPAEQYIYESILQPDAFIAPECKDGQPCQTPSAMPDYSSLLNLQDAADLLAFLLDQRAVPASRPAPAAAPAVGAQNAPTGTGLR
jgi:hypothetical protein